MEDMDILELQALERLKFKSSYESGEKEKKINSKTTASAKDEKKFSYPDFKEFFSEESKEKNSSENKNSEKLNKVLRDPETALLMGLILLLKTEGADETLLAALGYILL